MLTLLQGGKTSNIRPETAARFPVRAETARRLTVARELAGLTVRQAGRLTGLSVDFVSSLEAAVSDASARDLAILCETYCVSVDWMLGRVPELACPSELEGYANKLPEDTQFRLLTILASAREVKHA